MSDWKPLYKYILAPVTVGIISLCLTLEYNSSSPYKPLTWINNTLIIPAWNGFNFSVNIPIWSIIFILCALYLVIKIKPLNRKPLFVQYTQDNIMGINWIWEWYEYGSKWTFDNFVPYCPKCHNRLEQTDSTYNIVGSLGYICHNCSYKQEDNKGAEFLLFRVKQEVERRIRTNEFLEIIRNYSR